MLKITTNNVPRHIIYGFELSEKQRKEFDYLEGEELDCRKFFKYRGEIYDLGEFMRIEKNVSEEFDAWDGYSNVTYFSGVLVRLNDENSDEVVVGRYYS